MNYIKKSPFAKPFAWSYSKLKNYNTCPKRHYHVDLIRDIAEPEGEELKWGNYLHDKLARAIGTDDNEQREPRDRIPHEPLPKDLLRFEPWVARFRRARESGAHVYTELQLAITREFQPCAWFAKEAWFRTKVDVLIITADWRYAAGYDWKTGKRLDETEQLLMSALALMIHHKSLQAVRTEYVWLKDWNGLDDKSAMDRVCSRVAFERKDTAEMWNSVAPKVIRLETAFANREYPAKPSGLCKRFCPVTSCEHNGSYTP